MKIRIVLLALALVACHTVHADSLDQAEAQQRMLIKHRPLLAEAVRSVGHICDTVDSDSVVYAPGVEMWQVVCNSYQATYTIGIYHTGKIVTRAVVWVGRVM
jgi:hypothetical protein